MSHGHGEVSSAHYVKIWGILLALLIVSICGPMLEIKVVTLITAFGIAIVKAYIVAAYFMHLNVEKKYIIYMLLTMLIFMGLFFSGTAVDIVGERGSNWDRTIPHARAPAAAPEHH
jgi:caa(3)-type oxidase subunit IV